MSGQGSHFINCTISALREEFQIQHKKRTPYHLQDNGTVEVFNTVLEHALTKVCNVGREDWDLNILATYSRVFTLATCKSTSLPSMRQKGRVQWNKSYNKQIALVT